MQYKSYSSIFILKHEPNPPVATASSSENYLGNF